METSIHVAFYKGLLVGIMPYHMPEEFLEEMPTRGHYFDAIRTAPGNDPCESLDTENESTKTETAEQEN